MNKATRKVGMKINNVVNQRYADANPATGCLAHPRTIYANAYLYARNAIMHSAITHVTRKRQHFTNVDSVYKKRKLHAVAFE